MLLLCGWTLLACEASPQSQQHLLSPTTIAKAVGLHYGDPHATVVKASPDRTDNDDSPMYLMTVAGELQKDGVQARTVMFSALATRPYVWDLRGFDRTGQQVWSEEEWGECPSACTTDIPVGRASPATTR